MHAIFIGYSWNIQRILLYPIFPEHYLGIFPWSSQGTFCKYSRTIPWECSTNVPQTYICLVGMEYRNSVYICKFVVSQRNICYHAATLGRLFYISFSDSFNTIFILDQFTPLFHPTFHSYDIISNVKTLNFRWSEAVIGGVL